MKPINAKIAPCYGATLQELKKGLSRMCKDLNIELKKAQGVTFAYLPNPDRLHKPLMGISKIDTQWICMFYLSAWDLLPDRYDVRKSKQQNKNAVLKLRKKFIATAKKSGVTIARNVGVTGLLQNIQKIGVVNMLGYERAETLLAALHYLQFVGGDK